MILGRLPHPHEAELHDNLEWTSDNEYRTMLLNEKFGPESGKYGPWCGSPPANMLHDAAKFYKVEAEVLVKFGEGPEGLVY